MSETEESRRSPHRAHGGSGGRESDDLPDFRHYTLGYAAIALGVDLRDVGLRVAEHNLGGLEPELPSEFGGDRLP